MAHSLGPDRRRTSRPTSRSHEHKSLLRFITCGSVDDGKSTLIGRLLYESQAGVRGPARRARGRLARRSARRASELDFALLVDGLAAEREQGITIDVAYRFFSTEQAQVHRRRHARATSSTRATWSPAPRPPTSR